MLHITSIEEGTELFKALGSETRIAIIKLLIKHDGMNMSELAKVMAITNGALTTHIRKLEACGIVTIVNEVNGHGNLKRCKVNQDKILIELNNYEETMKNVFETSIKVGQYSNYEVYPTCGLATQEALIGEVDDPRYFSHEDHYHADILWFTQGYVEYMISNLIPANQKIDQITISAELSSEAPGSNEEWPSDVHFYLNGTWLGVWTSPGDYGHVKGNLTPDWWERHWNQYGLLKQIMVNHRGSFVDGMKISDVTIDELKLDYRSQLKLRLEIPSDTEHVGGLTIFGKTFGNYSQDIKARIHYSQL